MIIRMKYLNHRHKQGGTIIAVHLVSIWRKVVCSSIMSFPAQYVDKSEVYQNFICLKYMVVLDDSAMELRRDSGRISFLTEDFWVICQARYMTCTQGAL